MIQNNFKSKTSESVFKGKKVALMEKIKNEFSTNNASGKNIQKRLNPDRWMPIEILKINILSLSSGLLTRLKKTQT